MLHSLYLRYRDQRTGAYVDSVIDGHEGRVILRELIKCYESEIIEKLVPVIGAVEARMIHDLEKKKEFDANKRRYLSACFVTKELRRFNDD